MPEAWRTIQVVRESPDAEPVGTLFHATGRRRPTRLLWLAHATEPRGQLVLDDGAVRAVTQRRASLLPAGVVEVRGYRLGLNSKEGA